MLPGIGPVVSEVIGEVIPNQRVDRIADMLGRLDQRVRNLEGVDVDSRIRTEEYVDLLEDGISQASRAFSEERREEIAAVLEHSLTDDELEHIQKKTLLSLLGELNDAEVLILKSYGFRSQAERREFYEKHGEVIQAPPVSLGSSQEEIDRGAIHGAFRSKLISLGLLRENFREPRGSDSVEMDFKTGRVKASGYKLTNLGRLLLRYTDEDPENRT